jgi:polyribonucleotide nucleotidyltransferase
MRSEGRPSEDAILSARIVDSTIRPLFPSHLRTDVQIVISLHALGEDDPDILGVL